MTKRMGLIGVVLLVAMALSVPVYAEGLDDRVENNITIDGLHWGIAARSYLNYDTSHLILRYRADNTWSGQYRYVTKNAGDDVEHWFRVQHKTFSAGGFFFRTRIEQRFKETSDDVLRVRPQMGYKWSLEQPVTLYYKFEPQWEYRYNGGSFRYRFGQHFLGFDYKLSSQISVGPFLEIDTNDEWEKDLMFLGLEVGVSL